MLLCPISSPFFLPWVQIGSWLCHKAQRGPTIPEVTQEVMPGRVQLSQVSDSLPGLYVLPSAALSSGNLYSVDKLKVNVHLCLRHSSWSPGKR